MLWIGVPALEGFLLAIVTGYGLMLVCCIGALHGRFPQREENCWDFLRWLDRFRPLAWTGLLTNCGLFVHLVLLWHSPVGVQVKGLLFSAPYYDVPAMLAFLSILITTVNFVVSVEVNFYPAYRDYCSLFNEGGTIGEITAAEKQLLVVQNRELWYTALKQLFCTAAVISLENAVLAALPLGFNDMMHGYFRTLCVGYGLYAVGNTILLTLLYLTDVHGAAGVSALFAAASTGCTALLISSDPAYYGFGFLLGGGCVLPGSGPAAQRVYGRTAVSHSGQSAADAGGTQRHFYPAGAVAGTKERKRCRGSEESDKKSRRGQHAKC